MIFRTRNYDIFIEAGFCTIIFASIAGCISPWLVAPTLVLTFYLCTAFVYHDFQIFESYLVVNRPFRLTRRKTVIPFEEIEQMVFKPVKNKGDDNDLYIYQKNQGLKYKVDLGASRDIYKMLKWFKSKGVWVMAEDAQDRLTSNIDECWKSYGQDITSTSL